jgi:hypothetical protein
MGLAAVLAIAAPRQADAAVHIGVSIGAPVYPAPVAPYAYSNGYAYGYQQPYVTPVHPYTAPVYVAPRWRDDRHERFEHRDNDRHDNDRRDNDRHESDRNRSNWRR